MWDRTFRCRAILFVVFFLMGMVQKGVAYSGGNGTAGNPYLISTKAHLTQLAADMADVSNYLQDLHYKLIADINLDGTIYDEAIISPLSSGIGFYATLDGNGHAIENLRIHAGVTGAGGYPYHTYLGLIGTIGGGTVRNLGIENFQITRDSSSARVTSSGALCGLVSGGTISNCYSSGHIDAGLDASVIGGLCGSFANSTDTLLVDSYSSVSIGGGDGASYLGGLCGSLHSYGRVIKSYASGAITSGSTNLFLGGICGLNWGHIEECYSEGDILAGEWSIDVGGLCGQNAGTIINSYAHGDISGGTFSSGFGGFCGKNNSSGILSNCYAAGAVSNVGFVFDFGGFCGGGVSGAGINSGCFWDTQTSGMSSSSGGTGKHTSQMQSEATFISAGWDFSSIWSMDGYPVFKVTDPFMAWINNEGIPVGLRGDNDAPAGDGIPNLLKYAVGLSAMQSYGTSNLMFNGTVEADSFSLVYYKSQTATGVVLEPIWTSSLINAWSTTGVTDVLMSDSGEREERKASIPLNEGGFIKLQATRVP